MALLITHVVVWDKAVAAARAGKLSDYLHPEDEIERAEDKCSLDDFATDSCTVFTNVADAYSAMRRKLPPDEKTRLDSWFGRIFPMVGAFRKWHGDDAKLFNDDAFERSFSPETISELAQVGKSIRFETMRDLFYLKCPKDGLEIFTEYSDDPEDPFKGCFLPYLKGWVKFLSKLDSKKWGLLLFIG